MIPKSVLQKLRYHEYLDKEFYDSLEIHNCRYQYEVFEKVFTTIAKKHNMSWRSIYNAKMRNTNGYTLLCVCLILIDKALKSEFRLKIIDRESLLMNNFNHIVADYYKFI
jgi:hypothetical protein